MTTQRLQTTILLLAMALTACAGASQKITLTPEEQRLGKEARERSEREETIEGFQIYGYKMVSPDSAIGCITDQVEAMTWCDHAMTRFKDDLRIYIGQREEQGEKWLRLRTRYLGADWIFANQLIFAGDAGRVRVTVPARDVDRNVNSSGHVTEALDFTLTRQLREQITPILKQPFTLRIRGKDGYYDHRFDEGCKACLEVLEYYDTIPKKHLNR